jgi:hypothetical protein
MDAHYNFDILKKVDTMHPSAHMHKTNLIKQ